MVTVSFHNQKGAMVTMKLRRRCRSDLIRLSVILISAVFVIFLLSKSKTNDQDFMSDDIFGLPNGLDRNNEALIKSNPTVIKQLSAKEAELYHKLNPVIEGWGKQGKAVYIEDPEEKVIAKKQFDKGAFNVYISDRISPNRSVPDPRPAECEEISYDYEKLGTSSVVIIFTDEIWSALIRTIWSVWNRTPHRLLKEIILVDDASKRNELQDTLRNYCSHYFGNKVKLLRSDKRIGLIRARLVGAKAASGDVIVFLDSHCETTNGWLEPLMATIAENPKHVVCPVIDVIDDKTLAYNYGTPYYFQLGSFTWSGHYTWMDLDEEKLLADPTKPVASPTMAGGLLAINRDYFFSIGSYDEAMEIWGGENLEMSFRIWQCGGNLSIHPCSHVGHIFRDYHPYSFQGKDTHGINTLRTMLVWMDPEYQRYFFMHRSDMLKKDAGDLTDRLELKKRLQCKSFKWYLDNIFEGRKFIYDQNAIGWGTVSNRKSGLCLDTLNENEEKAYLLGVFSCEARPDNQYTNQFLTLTVDGELRREETCATAMGKDGFVKMEKCMIVEFATKKSRAAMVQEKKKQRWKHLRNGLIIDGAFGQCLSTKKLKSMSKIKLVDCNPYDPYQKWKFQTYSSVDFT